MTETGFSASSSQPIWTGPRGYGRRHILDDADFSLWDASEHDFRYPEPHQIKWLGQRYKASRIAIYFPTMIIETDDPPHPLPLTVAGVATKFVPLSKRVDMNSSGAKTKLLQDPRPIKQSTNYTAVRKSQDPLPFTLPKWVRPTNEQLKLLVTTLFQICNPQTINVLCPWIIIELCGDDKRAYQPGSLPSKIGGYAAVYHHKAESVFKWESLLARTIKPSNTVQDTTNYLNSLCPGVRVESETFPSSASSATTAGVLVENNLGAQRLTVANHGFLHTQRVFHPSASRTQIGEIDKRWLSLDIALVDLNPSVNFSNSHYFEADPPKRLLRSREIRIGDCFALDGMSTGLVFVQAAGVMLDFPERPSPSSQIEFRTWTIYEHLGARPSPRLCGAAFVNEDGGVAGFFQLGNHDYACTPCLDEFIDRSWNVVQAA